MTSRRTLKCISCDTKVLTRTQIGHKDVQHHSFACPKCGVSISFAIDLDQAKPGLKYRPAVNATWIDGAGAEDGVAATMVFSDEVAVPTTESVLSPFIATVHNYDNYDAYLYKEAQRRRIVKADFDYVERCRVHFERGAWDLFDKESPTTDSEQPSVRSRLASLHTSYFAMMTLLLNADRKPYERIRQRLAFAATAQPTLIEKFAEAYLQSGHAQKIWRAISAVRSQTVRSYDALQVLVAVSHWRPEHRDLMKISLSPKAFDRLKLLYVDAFEALSHMLAIVGCYEGMIQTGNIGVETTKRVMGFEEFDAQKSATKRDIVGRLAVGDLFAPVLDSDLRNGIGHISAHYDTGRDEIVVYRTKGNATQEERRAYTVFCEQLRCLLGAFELGAAYHADVHLRLDGRLVP